MQLYSENEKAFLLIHFNLNYGIDLLGRGGRTIYFLAEANNGTK